MSAKYYLLGEKLKHSYSSLIHKRRGYDYELKEIEKSELGEFVKSKNFSGLNVTVPYKTEVIKYLDCVEKFAAEIGAVNTVVNKNGKLYGYNTDVSGLAYTLKRADIKISGKNVLVLGSGGASKTAVALFKKLGAAKTDVVSRTGEVNYENCYTPGRTQVVVNCTPVGTFPYDGARPIDLSRFPTLEGVVDLTYNPSRTQLILQAEELGVKAVNGLYMLVVQAFDSEELFDGKTFAEEDVENEVKRIRRETDDVVLVGASGAGKSTVGKILGALTEREVVDTDEAIKRAYGISAGDIITRYGEEYFREIEERVVDEACQRRGVIVVTGGGAVTRRKNRDAMRRCGKVFWICRDADKLASEGRPLAVKYGAKELLEMRKPLYNAVCDIKVENADSAEDCAGEILKLL